MAYNRAARLRSWNEPLNFDLHVDRRGEPRVPFALHVQPKPSPRLYSACTGFYQFSCLPTELQGHILYFCDSAKLFQLTQVSLTRREATKLFWSDPHTWYSLDIGWLRQGGSAGETYCNLDLLAYVKHVEVDLGRIDPEEWTDVPYHERSNLHRARFNSHEFSKEVTDPALPGTGETKYRFWRLLLESCPQVTHVLVSTSSKEPNSWDLLRLCPANILVSVSLLQEHSDPGDPYCKPHLERSLWQLGDRSTMISAAHKWEKVLTDWEPRIILLPPKLFRGPVGTFQRSLYKWERFIMQNDATELLCMEFIERNHFHNTYEPFVCFTPGCGAQFEKPGEYTLHATKTGHYKDAVLPENIRVLFERHRQKLDRLHWEAYYEPFSFNTKDDNCINNRPDQELNREPYDHDQTIVCEMEEEVLHYAECFERQPLLKQRKDDANRAFLHHLEHDPLYAVSQLANQSTPYNRYLNFVEEAKQEHWELCKS